MEKGDNPCHVSIIATSFPSSVASSVPSQINLSSLLQYTINRFRRAVHLISHCYRGTLKGTVHYSFPYLSSCNFIILPRASRSIVFLASVTMRFLNFRGLYCPRKFIDAVVIRRVQFIDYRCRRFKPTFLLEQHTYAMLAVSMLNALHNDALSKLCLRCTPLVARCSGKF